MYILTKYTCMNKKVVHTFHTFQFNRKPAKSLSFFPFQESMKKYSKVKNNNVNVDDNTYQLWLRKGWWQETKIYIFNGMNTTLFCIEKTLKLFEIFNRQSEEVPFFEIKSCENFLLKKHWRSLNCIISYFSKINQFTCIL